jgi:hypothetical protein
VILSRDEGVPEPLHKYLRSAIFEYRVEYEDVFDNELYAAWTKELELFARTYDFGGFAGGSYDFPEGPPLRVKD